LPNTLTSETKKNVRSNTERKQVRIQLCLHYTKQ